MKRCLASISNYPDEDNREEIGGFGDRFIPNRATMDMQKAAYSIRSSVSQNDDCPGGAAADATNSEGSVDFDHKNEYKSVLSSAILGIDAEFDAGSRILAFKEKAPAPKGDSMNNLKVLYSVGGERPLSKSSKSVSRHIPSTPSRILDAPDLLDDYYLNLISWSDTNILAVALGQAVYLWNAGTGEINELCTFDPTPNSYISSVQWTQQGGVHLAVGTSTGAVQLWDVQQGKLLRSMDGHTDRVGSLSWNNHNVSSGGRDSIIVNHDVRIARHNTATLSGHSQEVCGLAWSPDGSTLASGGNDNTLLLWDSSTSGTTAAPRYTLTDHQAAVKALAWSPHERNLLATGGGTADRCIKFWNSQTGAILNSIDTGSQVCALQWNPFEKELLSSHGFARNQLCLWKYPTMAKVKEFDGHTARVLHMACSPDGSTVVSAAADETLRFWNVFAQPGKAAKRSADVFGSANKKFSKTVHIR
jgi:cell division cycle protein 20 (cofactor of APC complex)